MTRILHTLSAIAFYALGITFFVAYMLKKNEFGGLWPLWWMSVADVPLAFAACVYGGTSLLRSIQKPNQTSMLAALLIGLPLALIFIAIVVLNFWPLLVAGN